MTKETYEGFPEGICLSGKSTKSREEKKEGKKKVLRKSMKAFPPGKFAFRGREESKRGARKKKTRCTAALVESSAPEGREVLGVGGCRCPGGVGIR